MRLFIFYWLIFLNSTASNGQQTANYVKNWHFGMGSGISFTTGAPVNITSNINSAEAMSTFSDGLGNALFYTASDQIWDASHTVMPNGIISGDVSATCGVTICRVPGNCNQYYVFYIEHGAGGAGLNNSLHYSLIDMTLPGNGTLLLPMGDVVAGQKDILLYNIDNLGEKLLIVQKGNTENYWLIARSNTVETFYSFEVTSLGINAIPVSSIVSLIPYPPAPAPFSGNVQTFLGWLAINRDRNIIAEANGIYPDVRVYDFNNVTGTLSNQEVILSGLAYIWDIPYGIAFSESGNSLWLGWTSSAGLKLFSSFDVTGGVGIVETTRTDHDISLQLLGSSDIPRAVVLGRDGKIYFGWGGTTPVQTQLGVINDPDNLTTPGIIANGHTVTNSAELGLPNIPYYYHPNNFIDTLAGGDRLICPSDQANIGATAYDSIWSTYSWEPAAMVVNPNSITTLTVPLAADQQFILHTIHACGDTIKSDTTMVSVACILLSVELLNFTANEQEGDVMLEWTTLTETNNDQFIIEHSTNGNQFSAIGSVQSQGNRQNSQNYSFIDRAPNRGWNYYRLRQVDFDGAFENSDIRTVRINDENQVLLHPNPSNGDIIIESGTERIEHVIITDLSGKTVFTKNIDDLLTIELSLTQLSAGYYTVHLKFKKGQIENIQFLIN